MTQRQQDLVKVLLADPAVDSVSSFIGADGTNTTLNSGRIQINLKPLDARRISATAVIERLGPKLAQVPGIKLYMQPVQDLTVDDRVSRTEYQYTVEDPNPAELNTVVRQLMAGFQKLPELADLATDQQLGGAAESLTIDRATASRFGITPQTIDNTLYDAFGQRQINTMYTQLNQYHVILETDPQFQTNPERLHDIYIQSSLAGASSASAAPNTAGSSSGAGAGAAPSPGNALLTPSSGPSASLPPASASALSALASGGNHTASALTPAASTSALSPSTAASTTNVLASAGATGGVSSSANTSLNGATRPAAPSPTGGGGGTTAAASAASNPVPLSALTHFQTLSEPLSIAHQGQFPAVTISFNLAPGYSLGQALTAMNKAIVKANLPASVVANYQGTAAAFEGSLSNQDLLILAALVTVYIVLGVLYESFVHPVTILSTLPSAGVGALLALLLFHLDLDIVAIIGIILSDRHREEERHHDGGLRAGSRAQRGQERHRSHLPGFAAALPAHHDDHDGGAAQRHSAGVRLGHRLGIAETAGRSDGGRPAGQPGADALHHAGDLHLLRQLGRAFGRRSGKIKMQQPETEQA